MAISQSITPFPTPPLLGQDQATFDTNASNLLNSLDSYVTEVNTWATEANSLATTVNNDATTATAAASSASASANNYGNWSALTGALNIPASVNHSGFTWVLNVNLADVTLSEPTDVNTDWTKVALNIDLVNDTTPQLGGDLDLNGNSILNLVVTGSITEEVYSLTGTDIDPTNGTIQYKTLSTNTTLTESLADGQAVLLRLAGGDSYTVTWFTVNWIGGEAPTLTANDALVFWQEGTTVYGSYLGTLVQV